MSKKEMYKEMILTAVKSSSKPLNAKEIMELVGVPEEDLDIARQALTELVLEHKLYLIAI